MIADVIGKGFPKDDTLHNIIRINPKKFIQEPDPIAIDSDENDLDELLNSYDEKLHISEPEKPQQEIE